jgi:hypothetical protein
MVAADEWFETWVDECILKTQNTVSFSVLQDISTRVRLVDSNTKRYRERGGCSKRTKERELWPTMHIGSRGLALAEFLVRFLLKICVF